MSWLFYPDKCECSTRQLQLPPHSTELDICEREFLIYKPKQNLQIFSLFLRLFKLKTCGITIAFLYLCWSDRRCSTTVWRQIWSSECWDFAEKYRSILIKIAWKLPGPVYSCYFGWQVFPSQFFRAEPGHFWLTVSSISLSKSTIQTCCTFFYY